MKALAKKYSRPAIVVILLIAGSTGVVYAFGKHGDWGMSVEEKIEFVSDRVTRKLDLVEQQQRKFTELAKLAADTLQQVRPSREQRLEEMKQLLQEPSFNQTRALELVQEKTRLVNEQAPLLVAALAGFLDSLDAGQKQQLQEFLQHRHEHHRH